MICDFCGQWNADRHRAARSGSAQPDGGSQTVRCAFCRNLFGSETDQTIAGRVTLTGQQLASIPKAMPSQFDKPGLSMRGPKPKPAQLPRAPEKTPLGVIVGVGIAAVGLFMFILKSCLI